MKLYYHSEVLSQRLTAFYEGKTPEYLEIEVKGFKEKLKLRAKPGSEFMATANANKFKMWEQSSFAEYDQRTVLKDVRSKISRISFMDKSFKNWREFEKLLQDSDVAEGIFRSTVEFPKSVEVAMRLKAEADKKNMKQVVIDALRAYL